ncbi:nicotinate (nicotinamide) nucleotide adenylyltransferase [Pollutimonas thiosulfatoxidans]|uniref:Probable nicotinate-nucleotide adenylyltransferase n=1 Tax=Pollutimonas thiosulfatoxidans TaxID=2028345 RepID=A0A410GBQ3_9BURK|nr:nicotinate (nicotinamide) nucleotide adenylyltransferase [Pollutimonas thiosulfatoxidans]QAA93720.1 nicotinate (nicotinamide) nucleotide adenylyltransferase [Pollutimonas thiosulfatoxidans]
MVIKTGLLGGSFDPVHLAHVALARVALQALDLAEVQFIPAGTPWQRDPLGAPAQDRVAMLELAVGDQPGMRINPIEVLRGGNTYTIDTLRELPPADYYWILGTDQLQNFCTWEYWQEITSLVHLAVALRPGSALVAPEPLQRHLKKLGKQLLQLPFTPMPVSSTQIRDHLAADQPTDGMLDPAVAKYIKQKGLYRAPAA